MSKRTCLYLGPAGSFCHQAALRLNEDFELKPAASVAEIVAAVEAGESDFGLVPIENSVDGEVTSTVDSIVFNTTDLLVRDEVVVPVEFDVFVKPGVTSITRVMSHPVALAQCQNFITANSLTRETSASTSAAVQTVAEGNAEDVGALASPITFTDRIPASPHSASRAIRSRYSWSSEIRLATITTASQPMRSGLPV